jgi:hypothetical protein
MAEKRTLAVRALRQLLDDADRTDWDELIAANRSLLNAMATGKPMMQKDVRIVAGPTFAWTRDSRRRRGHTR